MVFQALRHLGQTAVDNHVVARIRRALSAEKRRELVRDARYTTDWIGAVIQKIANDDKEPAGHG